MKHAIIPFEDQTLNTPIDLTDPDGAKKAIELRFPSTFSAKALKMADYLKDTAFLYLYKTNFVLTDESLHLTGMLDVKGNFCCGPRWVGDSLEELEVWLEQKADECDKASCVPGWIKSTEQEQKQHDTTSLWAVYEKQDGQFTDSYFTRTWVEAENRMKSFIRDNLYELPLETYYGEDELWAMAASEQDKFMARRMEVDSKVDMSGDKLPDIYRLHPLSLIEAFKEAQEAGYHTIYDPNVMLHRKLDEFMEELDPYRDGEDYLYVRFGSVIVQIDEAWKKDACVYQLV